MAQEWETEILVIKSVEERKGRNSNNVFWVITTDKGEYTLFEANVFDKVAENQGNKCELKTFRDESHANIKQFVKVVEVGKSDEPKNAPGNSSSSGPKIEMLVSYAKDLVVAKEGLLMANAMDSVIAAYKKASSEL